MTTGSGTSVDALVFVLLVMFIGAAAQRIPVIPHSVSLFLAGILLSLIATLELGYFSTLIDNVQNIDPHIILYILLPPLLFESASNIDFEIFKRVQWQTLWLAFPVAFLSIGLLAPSVSLLTGISSWSSCFLLSSILASTDPVSVVQALAAVGAPKKLSCLVDGEALLNDGSAFVLFAIFSSLASADSTPVSEILGRGLWLVVGGLLVGYSSGVLMTFLLGRISDISSEILLVVAFTFGTYAVGEYSLHVSGVLAVVVLGLYVSSRSRVFRPESSEPFEHVFGLLSYLSTLLIFVISGIVCFSKTVETSIAGDFGNWVKLLLLYVAVMMIRAVCIHGSLPLLQRVGLPISKKESVVIIWAGLRGAVGLTLALLVDMNPAVDVNTSNLINFYVNGIVILTLVLNGTTVEYLYAKLNPYPASKHKVVLYNLAIVELETCQMPKIYSGLAKDWLFARADREFVQKLVPDFIGVPLEELNGMTEFSSANKPVSVYRTLLPAPKPFSIARHEDETESELSQSGSVFDNASLSTKHSTHSLYDVSVMYQEGRATPSIAAHALGVNKEMEMEEFSHVDRIHELLESMFAVISASYNEQFQSHLLSQKSLVILKESIGAVEQFNAHSIAAALAMEWNRLKIRLNKLTCDLNGGNSKLPAYFSRTKRFSNAFVAIEAAAGYLRAHQRVYHMFIQELPSERLFDRIFTCVGECKEFLNYLEHHFHTCFSVSTSIISARQVLKCKSQAIDEMVSHGLVPCQSADVLKSIIMTQLVSLSNSGASRELASLCLDKLAE